MRTKSLLQWIISYSVSFPFLSQIWFMDKYGANPFLRWSYFNVFYKDKFILYTEFISYYILYSYYIIYCIHIVYCSYYILYCFLPFFILRPVTLSEFRHCTSLCIRCPYFVRSYAYYLCKALKNSKEIWLHTQKSKYFVLVVS